MFPSILNDAETEKHTGMISIDLQKFFVTEIVNFFDKIRYIGFSDKTINWFHSYLTNRCFLFH